MSDTVCQLHERLTKQVLLDVQIVLISLAARYTGAITLRLPDYSFGSSARYIFGLTLNFQTEGSTCQLFELSPV